MYSLSTAAHLPHLADETAGVLRFDELRGRFVEIAGGADTAALSFCAGLIAEAQRSGSLAAWAGLGGSAFYPPDFAAAGVDLAALPVIRTADVRGLWRACDTLLRSGGFALVVADVQGPLAAPFPIQTRLLGLAQRHGAILAAVTRETRGAAHRGSLASLRAETRKRRSGHDCFSCLAYAAKDKRHGPGWTHEEWRCGTDGLC